MKRDKQQSTFVNIGSSSLLIVFLVLCLTTFAILSLSSAQSDYNFSQRFAGHKTEYYEASSRAEMILGEIDQVLAETADENNTTGGAVSVSWHEAVSRQLDGAEIDHITLSCTNMNGETNISYQVPAGEKQALLVTLLVTNDSEHENYYQIRSWQLVSTSDWNADDSLRLMPVEQ